jgi:hypothetical protein
MQHVFVEMGGTIGKNKHVGVARVGEALVYTHAAHCPSFSHLDKHDWGSFFAPMSTLLYFAVGRSTSISYELFPKYRKSSVIKKETASTQAPPTTPIATLESLYNFLFIEYLD